MTNPDPRALIAGILTTLAEVGDAAESTLYIALGMDLPLWEGIRDLLVRGKLVTVKHHRVTITDLGRRTAAQLEAVLAPGNCQSCTE